MKNTHTWKVRKKNEGKTSNSLNDGCNVSGNW